MLTFNTWKRFLPCMGRVFHAYSSHRLTLILSSDPAKDRASGTLPIRWRLETTWLWRNRSDEASNKVGRQPLSRSQGSISPKNNWPFSIIFQLKHLDSQSAQSVESVKTLYVMKSRPLKDDPVDSVWKSKPLDGQQREDMFHEVRPSSQIPKTNIRFAHFLFFEYTKFNKFSFLTNLQSLLDIVLLLTGEFGAGTFGILLTSFMMEFIRAWIHNFCCPYVREDSGNFKCNDSTVNSEKFMLLPSWWRYRPQPTCPGSSWGSWSQQLQFNFSKINKYVSKKRLMFESMIFISVTKFVYFKTKKSQYQIFHFHRFSSIWKAKAQNKKGHLQILWLGTKFNKNMDGNCTQTLLLISKFFLSLSDQHSQADSWTRRFEFVSSNCLQAPRYFFLFNYILHFFCQLL